MLLCFRDLSARNLLVDEKFQAKVSDFGLSRSLDNSDTYQVSDSKIPIRWTGAERGRRCKRENSNDELFLIFLSFFSYLLHVAPEVFQQGTVTTKADVYSFGVVIWEVCGSSHFLFFLFFSSIFFLSRSSSSSARLLAFAT